MASRGPAAGPLATPTPTAASPARRTWPAPETGGSPPPSAPPAPSTAANLARAGTPPSTELTAAVSATPQALAAPATEIDVLQRASDALRASPATALALADDHARRFPRGVLSQEREVIAIEALVALGRPGEARDRAARLFADAPDTAHRPRIEALLNDAGISIQKP
jgi:hypothetical protein